MAASCNNAPLRKNPARRGKPAGTKLFPPASRIRNQKPERTVNPIIQGRPLAQRDDGRKVLSCGRDREAVHAILHDSHIAAAAPPGGICCCSIPFVALLWVPFYNRSEPSILGIPFFYWYQFLWVILTSLVIILVDIRTRRLLSGRRREPPGGRP